VRSWQIPRRRPPVPATCPGTTETLSDNLFDFDIRGLGRRLPKTDAPEGWVKKIERSREGKVWVGFFHLWTTDVHGRRVRTKKEKTLGPTSMPKHEAQEKLADYITEYTGRLTKQGDSISTFGELWKAFCAVKSGQWSKKTKENLQCLFGKHVVPIIGQQAPREGHADVAAATSQQNGGGGLSQIRCQPDSDVHQGLLGVRD
jgi:hypothetical protein